MGGELFAETDLDDMNTIRRIIVSETSDCKKKSILFQTISHPDHYFLCL